MKHAHVCLAIAAALLLTATVEAAGFDVASAVNDVGLDLYRQLSAKNSSGNLVLSPYSVESALALAYAGAGGVTRTEMAHALRFPADTAPVQSAFAGLRTQLEELAARTVAAAGPPRDDGTRADAIEWHAADRLFGQRGYAFRDDFLALMKNGFAAPFDALDFRTKADDARASINGLVEEQTHQKIRDLIPPGALKSDTRLVLVNALYLKAPWREPFKKKLTRSRPFHLSPGETRDVPTMQRSDFLGYAREDGFVVVSLDYVGSELQFLIVLPDAGASVDAVVAKLTPAHFARWAELGKKIRPTDLALWLPKFRLTSPTLALGPALRGLGVKSAFDEPRGSADFDGIAPRQPNDYLALSEVFHKTFIELDEEGTEAAAATGGIMLATFSVAATPPLEIHVDRPFLFAIQHRASGACLFLGRIADPR